MCCTMKSSQTSSDSTDSNSVDSVDQNIGNPMMEILIHLETGGIFESFVDEIDMARITLSCHFALDLLCYKAGIYESA